MRMVDIHMNISQRNKCTWCCKELELPVEPDILLSPMYRLNVWCLGISNNQSTSSILAPMLSVCSKPQSRGDTSWPNSPANTSDPIMSISCHPTMTNEIQIIKDMSSALLSSLPMIYQYRPSFYENHTFENIESHITTIQAIYHNPLWPRHVSKSTPTRYQTHVSPICLVRWHKSRFLPRLDQHQIPLPAQHQAQYLKPLQKI